MNPERKTTKKRKLEKHRGEITFRKPAYGKAPQAIKHAASSSKSS